jgi:hypothetical protein
MARLSPKKWEEVKAAYCVGKRTLEDIGIEFGVSHAAISQRAKKENWTRIDSRLIDDAIESRVKLTKLTETYNLVSSSVNAEIDQQASIRYKTQRNSALLADAIPAMIPLCESPMHLKTLADANKSIAETGVDKATTAIQINNQTGQNLFAQAIEE